jgi:MFS transporter, ACS family, glucarate transporter
MTSTIDSPSTVQRPTRVRVVVVVLATLLGMVTYLDRACISKLSNYIQEDLGLSEYQMGWAFTVFAISYGTMGIPCAWWADRVGTRKMLTVVVVAWSVFTVATGAAMGLISLLLIRFLFGVGEAGAWPAVTRTLSRWIPYRERGTAQGIVWVGGHITAGLTPMLVTLLSEQMHISWRWIFVVFGLVGLVWAAAWYGFVRDEPAEHAGVNEAELKYIMSGRKPAAEEECPRGWSFWRRLLTHRNVIALCLMYMPNSFIFFFCITWLPKYLSAGRNMDGQTMAFFAGLPLMLSVAADFLGGPTTDLAVRLFGPRYGRAGVGFASYLLAGLGMFLAAASGSATAAATFFALGTAANMFLLGSAWGTCQDIGGGHAGVVSATMNTAGQAAAAVCPLLVIYVKNLWGWDAPLVMLGASFLIGSLCWCFIDPRKKVFD